MQCPLGRDVSHTIGIGFSQSFQDPDVRDFESLLVLEGVLLQTFDILSDPFATAVKWLQYARFT